MVSPRASERILDIIDYSRFFNRETFIAEVNRAFNSARGRNITDALDDSLIDELMQDSRVASKIIPQKQIDEFIEKYPESEKVIKSFEGPGAIERVESNLEKRDYVRVLQEADLLPKLHRPPQTKEEKDIHIWTRLENLWLEKRSNPKSKDYVRSNSVLLYLYRREFPQKRRTMEAIKTKKKEIKIGRGWSGLRPTRAPSKELQKELSRIGKLPKKYWPKKKKLRIKRKR